MIQVDELAVGVFRVEFTERDLSILKQTSEQGLYTAEAALHHWLGFVIRNYKRLQYLERD